MPRGCSIVEVDGGVIEIYLCNASFPTIRGDPLEVIAFLSTEFLFFFFFLVKGNKGRVSVTFLFLSSSLCRSEGARRKEEFDFVHESCCGFSDLQEREELETRL